MSARTPFVPANSRPDSQAAHVVKEQMTFETTRAQFSVDSSNPLHAFSDSTIKSLGATPQIAKENIVNSLKDGPLNTSSLMKSMKRNKSTVWGPDHSPSQNQNERPPLSQNTPIRSGTADPYLKANQDQRQLQTSHHVNALDIISPIARRATLPSAIQFGGNVASDVFTVATSPSGFRVPALPAGNLPDATLDVRRDAHIPNSTLDFSYSNLQASIDPQSSQLPTPPTSTRKRDTPVNVTGQNIPTSHENVMSGSNNPGPRRVLLNPDGTRGPLIDEDLRSNPLFFPDRTASALKRYHSENGDSDTGDRKRVRNEDSIYGQPPESTMAQLANHKNNPVESLNSNLSSEALSYSSHTSYQYYPNPLTPPNDLNHMRPSDTRQQPRSSEPGSLDRLLGYDVETYIDEHLDHYENSVQKWKECTVDEWLAGAEEQAERFSKILEFVKDHMTVKMKLFASFDAKVREHTAVLTEREETLGVVRERLVHESMNVLGTGRQQESDSVSLA